MHDERIPREEIPWYPSINQDLCLKDQKCVEFCTHGVYEWDDKNDSPVVKNPYNCVVACSGCEPICPSNAIIFPDMEEFVEVYDKIKEKYLS